jgi:N-ethylmaleimide reductase
MSSASLFAPLPLGPLQLDHRVVMAPLTRMRAGQPGNVPTDLNAEYYGQRATRGGLIIAEATQVAPEGQGYPQTPGIHSDAQVAGWKKVTDAVHARGGSIFLQLWHVGRISHPSLQPGGVAPVAPSAVRPDGNTMTASWKPQPFETPRALATDEIPGLVASFRRGAENARAAGFDGVEIHAANGYLIEQFLQSKTNLRSDRYGGPIANRTRLLLEITDAVTSVWSADRVGVRLSPFGIANQSGEDEPMPLYTHAVKELDGRGLAYLHLIEPRASSAGKADAIRDNQPSAAALFRPMWSGTLIAAGGFDGPSAEQIVARGDADAVAFGRYFISNPDLPGRLHKRVPLTPYNRATFYGGGSEGYTDYACHSLAEAAF